MIFSLVLLRQMVSGLGGLMVVGCTIKRFGCPGRCLAVGLISLLLFSSASLLEAQQDDLVNEPFDRFLSAGDFAPARAIIDRTPDRQERDRLYARLASAQAASGSSSASLRSLSLIRSDLVRGQAVNAIATRRPAGNQGGAAMADFDSLIELISTTIAPDSWEEVGGAGTIQEFAGGVFVDTTGLLQKIPVQHRSLLSDIRTAGLPPVLSQSLLPHDWRRTSSLRKVSLTRLEKQIQLRWLQGLEPTAAMRHLAGIYEVKYLLVYPETGDLVIAGPAGPWQQSADGRRVNVQTGKPVLQLDDFVVLLRNAFGQDSRFGCSINPRQKNLAAAQAYLNATRGQAIKSSQRNRWLAGLRDAMGKQDVVVFGMDPSTRAARVLVEADYHMKLIGMGLEPGTPGVSSYLANVTDPEKSMSLLRWWFTLNYEAVETTAERNAFHVKGPGVKVLSENELLTRQGQRLQTGKSDLPTQQFAQSFTQHFKDLASKYPVYAELQNIFDLALVTALVRHEGLADRVDWSATHFRDAAKYRLRRSSAPTEVESVINHRVIGGKRIIAGVSGGVTVDAKPLVQASAIKYADYGLMKAARKDSDPEGLVHDGWWWD